jgi:hypothetical protein
MLWVFWRSLVPAAERGRNPMRACAPRPEGARASGAAVFWRSLLAQSSRFPAVLWKGCLAPLGARGESSAVWRKTKHS